MKFITEKELARKLTSEYGLPTSKKLLEKLRSQGKAPVFRKWSGKIVYEDKDITEWLATMMETSYRYTRPKYMV